MGRRSPTSFSYLLTPVSFFLQTQMRTLKTSQLGISLLEVLAELFVVSIGLLGVLAVIPFGAYQVSKANHAEYASNMLVNAAEEILIREMVSTGDSDKFVWFEPHNKSIIPDHISYIVDENLKEIMRGQDNLVYTAYADKRPDFRKDDDGKPVIQSSGKYTWFFTYLPTEDTDAKVDVDVLACYNRVSSDDRQVACMFTPAFRGGTLTLPDAQHLELLTQTKYVFMTWEDGTSLNGAWCKIVFLDKESPKIIVTGNLQGASKDVQVYIPSGVLYHKRVPDVKIK